MSNDDSNEERKIIIDEDWKSQVEREREQIQSKGEAPEQGVPGEIPEASFALLVTTLATQAMAAMGQIPDPSQDQPLVHLGLARHHIDTLAMLGEKTQGNLDAEEAQMLEQVIHQLRMLFVAVQNAPTGGE